MIFAILSFSIFNSPFSTAQTRVTLDRADIPHIPTDTLPTDRGEVRIVTFSDGTFRFIPANPDSFLDHPAYEAHWDTLNLFAYRDVELRELPDRIAVELAADQGFHPPVTGRILSKYGPRGSRAHNGIDIAVTHGQPVFAAFDGIVRYSRWNSGGFGNLVIIRHPNGLETYYAHLSRRAATAGEWVRAGGVIGYGGRTGRATTNHLHFEVRYSDQSFDPERIIDFSEGTLRQNDFVLHKEYFNIRSRAVEGIDEDPDPAASSLASLTETGGGDLSTASGETAPSATPEPILHTIRRGDQLLALALHYGTTVDRICALNGITRNTTLRIGRTLRIK